MSEEQYSEPTACQAEKNIHDICFFNWYQEEFLRGSGAPLDVCKEQWDTYQRCLQKKLDVWDLRDKIQKVQNEPFPSSVQDSG